MDLALQVEIFMFSRDKFPVFCLKQQGKDDQVWPMKVMGNLGKHSHKS